MTLRLVRVNILIREYLGDGKYGKSRSLTVYNLARDEVYGRVKAIFNEEKETK